MLPPTVVLPRNSYTAVQRLPLQAIHHVTTSTSSSTYYSCTLVHKYTMLATMRRFRPRLLHIKAESRHALEQSAFRFAPRADPHSGACGCSDPPRAIAHRTCRERWWDPPVQSLHPPARGHRATLADRTLKRKSCECAPWPEAGRRSYRPLAERSAHMAGQPKAHGREGRRHGTNP